MLSAAIAVSKCGGTARFEEKASFSGSANRASLVPSGSQLDTGF